MLPELLPAKAQDDVRARLGRIAARDQVVLEGEHSVGRRLLSRYPREPPIRRSGNDRELQGAVSAQRRRASASPSSVTDPCIRTRATPPSGNKSSHTGSRPRASRETRKRCTVSGSSAVTRQASTNKALSSPTSRCAGHSRAEPHRARRVADVPRRCLPRPIAIGPARGQRDTSEPFIAAPRAAGASPTPRPSRGTGPARMSVARHGVELVAARPARPRRSPAPPRQKVIPDQQRGVRHDHARGPAAGRRRRRGRSAAARASRPVTGRHLEDV